MSDRRLIMLVDILRMMAVVLSQKSTAQLRGLDSDTADQKEFNLFIWTLQGSIGAKARACLSISH